MAEADPNAHQANAQQANAQEAGAEESAGETVNDASADSGSSLSAAVLRDTALVFALLTLWGAGDAWSQTSGLVLAGFVAFGNAAFIGLALGAIFHEWGHYAGTRLSGAQGHLLAPRGLSLFRFQFDFDENDRRQFHWMTYGGWVAQWSLAIGLALLIPLDTGNRVALISAAVAFAVYATTIEIPVVIESRRGTDPQEALRMHIDQQAFIRSGIIGAVTGLFVFALIT